MIILISLFIGLFLLLFQPFGLQFVELEHKSLILMGYGLVTFVVMLINTILIPTIFTRYFAEKNWTVFKQITWLLWDVVAIAAGNYFYSIAFHIFPWVGFLGFMVFLGYTLPIALFPVVILTFIRQNTFLKKNQAASEAINASLDHQHQHSGIKEKQLVLDSGNQTYAFNYDQIVYMESEGNYVHVHYLEGDILKRQLVRITLKKVEEAIESALLMKCHRAFIVNLEQVKKVEGNSQGLTLELNDAMVSIPVARSAIKAFKEAVLKLNEL